MTDLPDMSPKPPRSTLWSRTPAGKIAIARWRAQHPTCQRDWSRTYRAKHRLSGTWKPCRILGCGGGWIITPHNGRRMFCDRCRPEQYQSLHQQANVAYQQRKKQQRRAA